MKELYPRGGSIALQHMQGHDIGTSNDVMKICLEKIRHWEFPLRRSNGHKQIREGAYPELTTKILAVIAEEWIPC